MIEVNAYSVLGCRKLDFMPAHFTRKKLATESLVFNEKKIAEWVEYKLSGRFSLCSIPHIDTDNRTKTSFFIGFEDEKELTYFLLACPYLRS